MTVDTHYLESGLVDWVVGEGDDPSSVPNQAKDEEEATALAIPSSLWFSVAMCGLAGLLFGSLLYNSLLAIVGWQGLFSLGNAPFYSFWTMLGVSGGILVLGMSLLLLSSARANA